MTALTHYERERAEYLRDRNAGSSHPDGTRRRIEQLERAVRRAERQAIGIAGEISSSGSTPNWLVRWIRAGGDEDAKWRWPLGYLGAGVLFLVTGPALLLGMGLYGLWYQRIAQWGPLRMWPFLLAGGNLMGFGLVWAFIFDPGFWAVWIWLQVALGVLRAAWRVRMWGWAGVQDIAAEDTVTEITLDALEDLPPAPEPAPIVRASDEPEPEPELILIDESFIDEPEDIDDIEFDLTEETK